MDETGLSTKRFSANFWIILAALLGIGAGSLGTWQYLNHYVGTPNQVEVLFPKKAVSAPAAVDPTSTWTSYSNTSGKFSVKHPVSWKSLVCSDATTVYLAPISTALAKCNSDFGGQMYLISVAGDKRAQYDASLAYPDKASTNVTVAGVAGTRTTATVDTEGALGPVKDTKLVQYIFVTGGRTYVAFYQQTPSGDLSQNVLSDFDLMVKNTLRFQ